MSLKNIIQKTILDVQLNGGHDGIALQQSISEWCRTELVSTLGDQLDRLDVDGTVVKIDSLEIDVTVNEGEHWMRDALPRIAQQLVQKSTEAVRRSIAPERNIVLVFMHFLQHGALPWWSDVKHYGELLDRVEEVTFQEDERRGLLELIRQFPVRQRLTLLPDTSFYKIATGIAPVVKDVWSELYLPFQDTVKTDTPHLTRILKDSILEHINITNPGQQRERIAATFKRYSGGVSPVEDSSSTRQATVQSDRSMVQDQQDYKKRGLYNDGLIAEGLYISDAGLVIVAPFLSALFIKTGLLHNGTIADVNKAVCLVHYLATGSETCSEPELGLAKILCGLSPDDVVDTTLLLDPVLKEEGLNVLASIVEHWSILKNTSVQGLQESFLQREGKLSFQQDAWQLRVVQQPYDMLLQHLPWNISMIKLSWMPYRLTTEWVF